MSFPSEKANSTCNNSMPMADLGENDETISVQDDQIRRAQLKIQLHGTRKGDDATIESYVEKLKSTADSLAAIGRPISDPDLVVQLLAGLPSQYSPYQKTISSQVPLPDFPGACSLLYMYESLLQEQKTTNRTGSDHSPSVEEGYYSKETLDKILDMFSTMTIVASTAWDLWNMLGIKSTTRTAAAAAGAATGNKKYTKRPNGGRGNYSKRGPSAGSYRNSGRK